MSAVTPERGAGAQATGAVALEALATCPLCGAPLGPLAFETPYTDLWPNADGHRYAYHRCDGCEVHVLANRPVPGPALAAFYGRQGGCAWMDPAHRLGPVRRLVEQLQARKRDLLAAVAPLPERARVLEVGCGPGAFAASLAATTRWEIHANELGAARPSALGEGVRYWPGAFEAGAVQAAAPFEAIVAHHVIEHAYDPRAFFAEARRLLAPGGVLVLETPNTACRTFEAYGADWGLLCAPRHVVLYSDAFFTRHAPAGFAPAEVLYDGYMAAFDPWAQSVVHAWHLPLDRPGWGQAVGLVAQLALNPFGRVAGRLAGGRALMTVALRATSTPST